MDFDIEKIWVKLRCMEIIEEETAILYEDNVHVSGVMRVNVGFSKEFPFAIKLPSVGRETYHSIHQNLQWLVGAYMTVNGTNQVINAEGNGELLVSKPVMSSVPAIHVKEVVREVVLIPCNYCGGLMPQAATFCPNCGARRKA